MFRDPVKEIGDDGIIDEGGGGPGGGGSKWVQSKGVQGDNHQKH